MIPILITGCHGLLGQKLVEVLTPDFGPVYGVDVHPASYFPGLGDFQYRCLDITNRNDVLEFVAKITPRIIINTAAMTNVDACEIEREKCWNLNVHAVQHLVDAGRRHGAKVIQLSTDYVFDGEAGPYTELDRPHPISYYGRSKHASENLVLGKHPDGTIVRTVVLFGHGRSLRPSFVSWLVKTLREGKEVKIVTDQISNVTLVDDLALGIKRIISLNKTGIWNIAGRQILSRHDFALQIADAYSLPVEGIQPTLTRLLGQAAPRPLQAGFVVDKAQKELNITFSNVQEALRKYKEQEASFN